ncbi:MAG: DEAD/DEAH box helicase family protein [Erysipelotrichaceae bacterium]|nr:DEAD/DEAH box helicase family protein [Erysipelotrichaceae bacterium]
MKCQRCGNEDPAYFYEGHKGIYCRKCVRFSRILLEEEMEEKDYEIAIGADEYRFDYHLTPRQREASRACLASLAYADVLLHCVCGAGKTEIAVESISHYLAKGCKVAYAIARKEVVIELSQRFAKIFPKAEVTAVYGGHHEKLTGDLIVCTCHQLYRYPKTFDLLIVDEVDAFPLKGDETLMNISLNACKGRVIFSTATIDDSLQSILKKRVYKTVELFVRPDQKPLPVPSVVYLKKIGALFYLNHLLSEMDRQCIIFVSGIRECILLYKIFSRFYSCTYVYSQLEERNEHIQDFRSNRYKYIFSTSVLERGVTIRNINVIILDTHNIFDESNLIQMTGRINRGLHNEGGKAYIIANRFDEEIDKTIDYLHMANSYL